MAGFRFSETRQRLQDIQIFVYFWGQAVPHGVGGASRQLKGVVFRRSGLDDLRAFPQDARRATGYQIDRIQSGRDPDDWKPMPSIGPGVREIRIREPGGAFRVVYGATFPEAAFVLHCFRKTSQKTAVANIALAKHRYADLVRELQS